MHLFHVLHAYIYYIYAIAHADLNRSIDAKAQ